MKLFRQLTKSVLPPPVTIRLRAVFKQHEPERALLPALCDPTRSGLDIGAALGAYSWPMAKYCAQCIAFEANADQASYLRQAFGKRVRVENLALSDRDGEIALTIPLRDDNVGQATIAAGTWLEGQTVRRVAVTMRTLDGMDLDPVGFIKLDVEGHEQAVLNGGRNVIARDKPAILVELEERFSVGNIANTRAFMEELGYLGTFLEAGKLRPMAQFNPQRHQQLSNWGEEGLYINNFVFIHQNNIDQTRTRLSRLGYAMAK